LHGNEYEYGKAIDKKYGEGKAQKLRDLGAIRGQKIHTKLAIEQIAAEYKEKAKSIAALKGVEI
jgi:hypothetical protein